MRKSSLMELAGSAPNHCSEEQALCRHQWGPPCAAPIHPLDVHQLVAAPTPSRVRDALATHAQYVAVLRERWHGQLRHAVNGRHRHRPGGSGTTEGAG
jgi:hypothetical protein